MISVLVAVIVFCLFFSACGKGETVQWKDEKFRNLVYDALEKDYSEEVTTKELDKITQLFLLGDEQLHFSISVNDRLGRRNVGITDDGRIYIDGEYYEKCYDMSLADLANFPNLVYITIYGVEYDNVDFAENMPDLVSIGMYHCGVEDISGLSGCEKLENVWFTFGNIEDISALEGKEKLCNINLAYNNISDISPLQGLDLRQTDKKESVWVTLSHNNISDISPLLGREYQMWDKIPVYTYSYVDLSYNEISDLSPFADHTYVGSWVLSGNRITDVAPLLSFRSDLEKQQEYNQIYLYENPAESFYSIKDFPGMLMAEPEKMEPAKPLEWQDPAFEEMLRLRLGKTEGGIYRSDLAGITHLYIVGDYMAVNSTKDIYKGADLATRREYNDYFALLEYKNGKETEGTPQPNGKIKSLADLANFPDLVYAMVSYQQVETVDIPKAMPSIETLVVRNNNISDIKGIANYPGVRSLSLACNNISDITPLKDINLQDIHTLDLKCNNVSDISPLVWLKDMGYLNLMMNNITDAAPLAQITRISTLYLDFNDITDISFLENCSVGELHIQGNPVKDYSYTSRCVKVYGAG